MKFKSKVFLAPMADVTDSAFRILCAKYGAGLTYTEMISSTALARKKENKLFDVQECEKPIAVQLMGNNLDDISKAVKLVQNKVDIIDFNMGCPMKKIVNSGNVDLNITSEEEGFILGVNQIKKIAENQTYEAKQK